jgi:hypothetical protein
MGCLDGFEALSARAPSATGGVSGRDTGMDETRRCSVSSSQRANETYGPPLLSDAEMDDEQMRSC